ncbi:hypothetical protein, partial [Helicobacter pylori]|uniref:hypothetical protein n=1 Tax=Helicobacter pylori TaxID=210 RepID=UPI002929EA1E
IDLDRTESLESAKRVQILTIDRRVDAARLNVCDLRNQVIPRICGSIRAGHGIHCARRGLTGQSGRPNIQVEILKDKAGS